MSTHLYTHHPSVEVSRTRKQFKNGYCGDQTEAIFPGSDEGLLSGVIQDEVVGQVIWAGPNHYAFLPVAETVYNVV